MPIDRFLAAFAAALLAAGAGLAEERPCAERSAVVERLNDRFGETLQSVGLNEPNVVEVYASDQTGSWTILVTRPDGKSCLLASGQLWQPDAAPLVKPGKDA